MPAPTSHVVTNQPPPPHVPDPLGADPALRAALARNAPPWAAELAARASAFAGDPENHALATLANESPPRLRGWDRYGHRVDEIEFHPSWNTLMARAVALGLNGAAWRAPRRGAHAARAARYLLWGQVEAGHGCPITMTYASVPVLRQHPEIAADWVPRAGASVHDPRPLPVPQKDGAILGMAMTEKQGGSDVRANTTVATPGDGGWLLTGHKWFCSSPHADGFLVLAQAPEGLTCFLVPRLRPDGSRNDIQIQRLKDKLGNRSNPSSEIELWGAFATPIGPLGRGVPTIVGMVNHTRLDCILGSTATMRAALVAAAWHAHHRSAFGRPLVRQPLMRAVLADLQLEYEGAVAMAMRVARAYDDGHAGDAHARGFMRIATAITKYYVCKRTPAFVAEALECLGGSGYVEESGMPRLFRESPLNGIWEGSGNVMCLDVVRALSREPEAAAALHDALRAPAGRDARYDAVLSRVERAMADRDAAEGSARQWVEDLALLLQAGELLEAGPPDIAEAFCASRLAARSATFGALPPGVPVEVAIARALEL
jgi:putative acyl-CoA dehydrogenase